MSTTPDTKLENEKPTLGPQSSDDESYDNPAGLTDKKILRKLDLKLLPPLTLLYLLSFLDRSNGTSRFSRDHDTIFINLTDKIYSWKREIGRSD